MKQRLEEYYSKFKSIYNEKNYPDWFSFVESHNHDNGYGDQGYKINHKDHELGHYAIFQTPIPELMDSPQKTKIIIVGKNNSWFIPDAKRVSESLQIVKDLEERIPSRNFYTERESDFAVDICSIFEDLGAYDLLKNNTVGMNRVWLQTGPKSEYIKKMKRQSKGVRFAIEGTSLVDICHKWTEEIIKLLNPDVLLLLGTGPDGADNLFDKKEGQYDHENGVFFIKHCIHPGNRRGGRSLTKQDISLALDKFSW